MSHNAQFWQRFPWAGRHRAERWKKRCRARRQDRAASPPDMFGQRLEPLESRVLLSSAPLLPGGLDETLLGDGGVAVVENSLNGDTSQGFAAAASNPNGAAGDEQPHPLLLIESDEFQVNQYTFSNQTSSTISHAADGGFVIAWGSYGQDGSNYGVYARRYGSDGQALGDEFLVNQYTSSRQDLPQISHGADGGFVIAWRSEGQDGSGYGVYTRRYGSDGQALGDEFQVNQYTGSDQSLPTISHGADGGFVIAWQSDGQDGSHQGVYARRYGSDGQALGDEFLVNQYTDSSQTNPTISHGADGGFVIA